MQLNNRSYGGHFLKDHHFYAHEGNLWNNLARASEKTFKWFHKADIEHANKIKSDTEGLTKTLESEQNSFMTKEITNRKIDDWKKGLDRKVERMALQEISKQPIDLKEEPYVENRLHSLDERNKKILALKRSAIKATLAGGGSSKNEWNDFSKLSLKAAKLNFPEKIIHKDEDAARMIFDRIIKDEQAEAMKDKEKWAKIHEIKKETELFKSMKSAAAYTRPITALTEVSKMRSVRPASHSRTTNDYYNQNDLHDNPSNQASRSPVTRERIVQSAPQYQIKKKSKSDTVTERLSSAQTASKNYRNDQIQGLDSHNIPIDKFTEFNGLFISKPTHLNILSTSLPYTKVLLQKSNLVQKNIERQSYQVRGMRGKSSSAATINRVQDPLRNAPKKVVQQKFSSIELNSAEQVADQLNDFDERFDPAELDMREKFYRKFPVLEIDDVKKEIAAVVSKFEQDEDRICKDLFIKLRDDDSLYEPSRKSQIHYIKSHEVLLRKQRAQSAVALKSKARITFK